MGEITGLVVLPQQLVGAVVNIAGSVCAVRDAEDIAVIIVGIGIGNIIAVGIYGVSRYLGAGLPRTGTLEVVQTCFLIMDIATERFLISWMAGRRDKGMAKSSPCPLLMSHLICFWQYF